jgi:hypothetical protein
MPTFNQMAEEVSRKMAGFTYRQDRQTHLMADLTSSSLSVTVSSAENISSGIIQIDDELLYVDSYNRSTGVLTIPPYGRGYNGTVAVAHTTGAKVVISPTYPTVDIKSAINETIQSVFPDIYTPHTYTFTFSPAKSTYGLPADAINVLSVSYQSIGPSKEWVPIRSYRIDNMANTASFDGSSNSITLYSGVQAGRTVQVYYSGEPDILVNGSDEFTTTTGLSQSCKDVIIFGAAYRLSSFIDPGHLSYSTAEADAQSQATLSSRSFAAGANASKYLYAIYQQRLQEEARKLDNRNPIRVRYSR